MSGPFSGLRVLDLTTTFLGPYCTLLMAEMGAEVTKVEAPSGDIVRQLGVRRSPGMAAIFLNLNRGKRSVVLNLKTPQARDLLLRLAEQADVFIHNMRPASAASLGMAYEDIRAVRPDIVYCGAYGFGEEGRYAGVPAYDDVIQGISGLADLQGRPLEVPQYVVSPLADKAVGLTATFAVAAALYHRERTGEGQAVDIPMFETMAHFTLLEQVGGRMFDPPEGPPGYARLLSVHRRPFATADGHICVVVYTDGHWRRFLTRIGREDLVSDPRFHDMTSRTEHIDEVYGMLAEILAGRPTAEWLQLLNEEDIPCVPLQTLESLFEDGHLQDVGFFRHEAHPTEGNLVVPGFPIRFKNSTQEDLRPAPRLGEHSREVLRDLGLDDAAIDETVAAGAVVEAPSVAAT